MITVEIAPAVMAELLFDQGVTSASVEHDGMLLARMVETLPRFRVCASCAPSRDDYAAVRVALANFWRDEAPSGRAAA